MPCEIKPSRIVNFYQSFTLLTLTCYIIFQAQCFNFKQVGRSSVSKIINERTTYSFVLDRTIDNSGISTAWNTQAVPSNGNVSIEFPSQYVLTEIQTCGSIVIVSGVSTVQTFYPAGYGCTISGNKVIFTGAFSSITDLYVRNVTLNYGNILNPSPAVKTGEFNAYLGNDVGVGNGQTWIQLTAATFTNCYITFGNGSFVNSTGPIIFNFTLLNQLNSSSTIRVNFPSVSKVWTNDISQTILPIQSGAMSCTGISNSLGTPTCTGNYSAFTVLASSIFSTVVSSGQNVVYQINTFFSPPTLEPIDTIKITSLTSGYEVDTCTTTISGLKPKAFDSLAIAPISGQMTVNANVGIKINMTFSDTIDQNDTFRVTFPTSLAVAYSSVSTSGSSEGVSSLDGQILSVNQNVNFNVIYYKDYFLVINFYTMTAPSSIKQSDSIVVEVLRNGYQKMIGSATVTATESSLVCSVTPQSLLVGTQSLYVFTVQLNDKLSSNGWLDVYFPSDISVNSSISIASASGTSVNSHPSINVDPILNKITVTSLNGSTSLIPSQTLTLTIGMISNPGTTKPTGNFTIKSYYQGGTDYLVATGICAGITATPGILKNSNISIAKSSDVVLANNVNYTISFVTDYVIPQNGFIMIEIPNDIGIDLINLQSNCYQTVNSSSLIAATCSAFLNTSTNKYQLTVRSIALTGNVNGNSSISIDLQGICTNPDTTRNILGFSINIYSADSYLIESANSGISTRASTPAQCLGVNVSRGSNKNSDTTNYTISLKQLSNLSSSSFLIITIPTQLQLTNATLCIDLIGTTTLNCTISANTITVQLSSQTLNNMTGFGIILTNVINTPSFQPLNDNFTLLTKTPDNLNKYCQYNSPFSFQNNVPSFFSSISGTFTPRIYNELTSLIVNFTPSTRLIPTYLMISVATQLIVESLSCSFQGVASGLCTQTSTNMIKVEGTFTGNSMQFTLGGLKAPKFSQSVAQYSSVSSFSATNNTIDSSINLISFSVLCTLPCKTCTNDNITQCLSCYQDITISTSIYYLNSLKTCYSVCPDGYYGDGAVLTCTACSNVCQTCSMVSDNCTTCNVSSTLKYLYVSPLNAGTCLTQCPTYYYINSLNICAPCVSPCNDCTSQISCLSCVSPFYMFNGSCTSQCPSTTTISNNATRNCDACSTVCATCSGDINSCVTCSSAAAFYNGSCVSNCPPPLVINAGQCGGCDSNCKQCSLISTNCTKCDTSSSVPYLYNSTCLSDCPSEYYKDILNGMCKLCTSLNIGCRFCSSVSACISCDAGFIFLNNKCYNYTPIGYYNDNGYAMSCTGDCATCVNYATNCTSCKTLNLDGYSCVLNCPLTKVAINKTCISCQSPCLTCSNIPTNCTSCLQNLTPSVFLNNFYCAQTCPDYTYANSTTSTCASCQSPCLKCTSSSSCLSCVNGKYLLNTTCYDTCPDGYIGINKICQPCTAPCMTCQITQTRCLSCEISYYLYNSSSPSCIQDCFAVSLYPDPIFQICTGCQSPCVTCSTTSRTCTSCSQSMILFNNSCISSCPSGYYQQASSCVPCPSSCATCTSSTVCQSCAFSYYFLLNYCISSCPSEYSVITTDGKCQKCSDTKCKNCTSQDYCQQCMQPYFLYLGTCVQRCPTNYNQSINSTNNFRQCVYSSSTNTTTNNATEQNITQTLKSGGNLFPVPLIIASAFIGVATIMSKFQNNFTFINGVLYSLWGLTQWTSVAIMLWYFYNSYGWHHIQFYILSGSFAFLYLLNFLALLIQNIYLIRDTNFNKWLALNNNRCFYYFVSITSFFTTHKFKNFIFCKMFNFVFLKAKLDSVQQFRVFNAFSFLSFLSSAGILFGLGLTFATYEQILDQKLMFFIDATVLTSINIFLAIFNSRKDPDFFQQKTQDGFIVHKRIQDFDELLYGAIAPFQSQQKFDQYETTGKKLMMNPYETKYRNLKSEISQGSVRVMDISIQADEILGEQSIITHLNDEMLSDFDLFEKKQVSIQFDQLSPQVHDQSVSIIQFKKNEVHDKSVSIIQFQNHEVSVQMDNVSQNQISVQVTHEKQEVSVQYGPNVLDHSIGMSRQEAEISIQANPALEQVSIQYSAKPVYMNVDQEYDETGNDDEYGKEQNEIEYERARQREQQSQEILRIESEKSQNSQIMSQNNSFYQDQIANRIKKPDALLQPQLELDINQKLIRREAQMKRYEEKERDKERLRIISDFQKKQALQQKPINYQVTNIIQEAFVPQFNQQNHQVEFYRRQTNSNSQSRTIMDSRFDILNRNKEKEFSSNQSRVQRRIDSQHSDANNASIGGQKSEQQFIEMLSGNKNSTEQNNTSQQVLDKNSQKIFNIEKEYNNNQLQQSNEISLNMTDENDRQEFGNQQQANEFRKRKNDDRFKRMRYKFEDKNQVFDSDQQENLQNHEENPPIKPEFSNQFTKSISTKNMTRINIRQPQSKRIEHGSLQDTQNEIENSFNSENDLAEQIVFSPLRALNQMKNKVNLISKDQNYPYDHSLYEEINEKPSIFTQNFSKCIKSENRINNYEMNFNIQNQREFDDDSIQNQHENEVQKEKQQPLPIPTQENQDMEENQNGDLEFQEAQKVFVSPLQSQEVKGIQAQPSELPLGVLGMKLKSLKSIPKKKSSLKTQNKSINQLGKKGEKKTSRSRQKPVQNELLNPSTSMKGKNITKQLQKQEKRAQNRKKNIELMEGMLERPSNSKKPNFKDEEEQHKRTGVEKIYLNRQNFLQYK